VAEEGGLHGANPQVVMDKEGAPGEPKLAEAARFGAGAWRSGK
jgi:hypothetical protein